MSVHVVQGGMTDRKRKRKLRKPTHTFMLETRPFSIYPFLLAPVLPGETLENVSMQSRVVSDPVVDKMGGVWLEYYLFYVKLRDLANRDSFETMLIDPTFDNTTTDDLTDDADHYFHGAADPGHQNWSSQCYARCIDEFFRGAEESSTDFVDAQPRGMAKAQVSGIPGWLDSMLPGDVVDTLEAATGITVSDGTADFFSAEEVEDMMARWQMAKMQGLTQKTFEDYLSESGVGGAAALEPHVPELLAYEREWTYPTNTIDPSDGSPTSAWVWSTQLKRASKKFFTEPGFLYGLTVIRPKVYFDNLEGNAASSMNNMQTWLTPDLRNSARAGLVESAAAKGQAGLGNNTEKYQWNVDDLLIHGDQWHNIRPANASGFERNNVSLPLDGTNIINSRYPADGDVNQLFVDNTDGSGLRWVHYDGIVNISINSYVRESMTYAPVAQV